MEISESYEVLDAQDNPIPGLYAAGEIVYGLQYGLAREQMQIRQCVGLSHLYNISPSHSEQ